MNWNVGFRAGYHACLVDRVTWQDGERFGITEGSINRTDTGLKESADLTATEYPHGMDRWIRIYLDAEQDGDFAHIPLFTGLTSTPEEGIDGVIHRSKIQCYSVLKPAQDIMLPIGWYAEKGFVCTEIIDSLLSVCPAPVVIESGSPRLAQHYIAEMDESNLTMIYKLLDAIGWRIRIEGDGTIHARDAVVKAYPHVVDVPVGGEHTLLDFQLMEHVTVARTRTALVGIVGTHLKVPHRER